MILLLYIVFLLFITPPHLDDRSVDPKSKDTPSVGSISGGGRYDDLVGMFDSKGRKVTLYMHILLIIELSQFCLFII